MKVFALAAALVLSLPLYGYAQTAAPSLEGDPVTIETLVDRAEIIRIVDTLDAAIDAKDWALARSLFTDDIDVDFTSLTGGEPATIPSDALIAGWSGNLTAEKESFHLRGNHRIAFSDADTAMVRSNGYAWNRMDRGALPENGGNPLWEVWGTYEHGFERVGDDWKINAMTFTATAERGSAFVRDTPGR
ncbi:MAG: nuclear transport factor 2 family protein [Inquilinaceae bacterium]